MSRSQCKMCGQELQTPAAIKQVRAHGESARTLSNDTRRKLRHALVQREVKLRKAGKDRLPGLSMQAIAEKYGCSRRTAIREFEWLQADGTLDKALEREGLL